MYRYIYVPLGGSNNIVLATTLVFTFVALWHDLSFRLLAWGWLVSLFILPEIIGRKMLPVSKVRCICDMAFCMFADPYHSLSMAIRRGIDMSVRSAPY